MNNDFEIKCKTCGQVLIKAKGAEQCSSYWLGFSLACLSCGSEQITTKDKMDVVDKIT